MNNEKYNGWTNYATWRINLEWFDGFNPDDNGYDTNDVYELSIQLKDYVESVIDETTPDGIAKDYALAFVSDVNYYEIAEHLIENNNEA